MAKVVNKTLQHNNGGQGYGCIWSVGGINKLDEICGSNAVGGITFGPGDDNIN